MSGKHSRSFVWTLNNFSSDDIARMSDLDNVKKLFSYLLWGEEVGDSGTPHLQGYAETNGQQQFKTVALFFGNRYHAEARSGSPKQAAGYCKKGTDYKDKSWCEFFPRTVEEPATWAGAFEYGRISSQGKRSDLTGPTDMIIHQKATIRDVAREFPEVFVKFNKGLRDLRALQIEPRKLDAMPHVVVLWGPTGTGKTRDAYLKFWPEEPHYVWKPSNGNWWDGYDGQKKIIIDEFRAQMTWSDILGLLDRNEYRAPFKGGFVNIVADKFVITSPFPPPFGYKQDDRYDRIEQLERRITDVHEYK